MTLRQAKWIVGKWVVEMFQRRQQEIFRTEETSVHGNKNFHIFMMYSNHAINFSVNIGSMMDASTKTL